MRIMELKWVTKKKEDSNITLLTSFLTEENWARSLPCFISKENAGVQSFFKFQHLVDPARLYERANTCHMQNLTFDSQN